MPKLERLPEPNMYQAYGIYLLESKHRLIRRLKKAYQPSVHGHKTWNSSFLLMDYLQHNPFPKRSRVIEIGCGWGPGSVYCAKRFSAKVTAVDIDQEVYPFLEVLSELNDVKVLPLVSRFEKLTKLQLEKQDFLVGSDICFWDEMVGPLSRLITKALDSGVKRVILTDPGRPTFYELSHKLSKKHNVELAEWYAVEPHYSSGEVVEIT